MSSPITWRNVDAPSFSGSTQGVAAAAELINRAFSNFQKPFQEQAELDKENWKIGKEANTNQMIQRALAAQTLDQYNQDVGSGNFSRDLAAMGAQVDGAKVAQLLDGRQSALQQRQLTANDFTTKTEDFAQQNPLARAMTDVAGAQTPEALAKVLGNLGSYGLSDRSMRGVSESGNARLATITAAAQAAAKEKRDDEMFPLDKELKKAQTNHLEAQAAEARAKAAGGGNSASQVPMLGLIHKLIDSAGDSSVKSIEAKIKGSPFAGDNVSSVEGRRAITKQLGDTGISNWNFLTNKTNFLDKVIGELTKTGDVRKTDSGIEIKATDSTGKNPVYLPLTAAMFSNAITESNGLTDPSVGDVTKALRMTARSSDFLTEGLAYAANKAKLSTTQEGVANANAQLLESLYGKQKPVTPEAEKKSPIIEGSPNPAPVSKPITKDPTVPVASVVPGGEPVKASNTTTVSLKTNSSKVQGEKEPLVLTGKEKWSAPVQAVKATKPTEGAQKAVLTFVGGSPDIQVKDGDTVNFKDLTCRIDMIDAPETAKPAMNGKPAKSGQAYGEESKQTLQKLLSSGEVSVNVTNGQDEYGRTLCQIEVEGKNVSMEMLKKGAAWTYRKWAPLEAKLAQDNAQAEGIGLFADKEAIHPREFKNK